MVFAMVFGSTHLISGAARARAEHCWWPEGSKSAWPHVLPHVGTDALNNTFLMKLPSHAHVYTA